MTYTAPSTEVCMRYMIPFLALTVPSVALAVPVASVVGQCPGPATVEFSGLPARSGAAILFSNGLGADPVPAGLCRGTETGLSPVHWAATIYSNPVGVLSFDVTLPPGVCGKYIQAMDVTDCSMSNVFDMSTLPACDDADGDGICDPVDLCDGGDDTLDADDDGIPDDCDACFGDDATGDSDGDGTCDSDDVCDGGDDTFDDDADGVPNDCDTCDGGIDALDADGDTVCDFLDTCDGGDDTFDEDGDTVADDCDRCPGHDDRDDEDGDGRPDGCEGAGACDHMLVEHISEGEVGQWCGGDALLYYTNYGTMTFDECQCIANQTGTQWYGGESTDFPSVWIGDHDIDLAVGASGAYWTDAEEVPRDSLDYECVLAKFDHRSEPSEFPVEETYVDDLDRVWHFWQYSAQTHSQVIAAADDVGGRIINPNSVGLEGVTAFTQPTHWCHAGAQFNGTETCNSDNICNFVMGYFIDVAPGGVGATMAIGSDAPVGLVGIDDTGTLNVQCAAWDGDTCTDMQVDLAGDGCADYTDIGIWHGTDYFNSPEERICPMLCQATTGGTDMTFSECSGGVDTVYTSPGGWVATGYSDAAAPACAADNAYWREEGVWATGTFNLRFSDYGVDQPRLRLSCNGWTP